MRATKSQIFISYARVDSEFALKLGEDLRAAGVKIWLDQLDISPGKRWDDEIEYALDKCGRFLIILSPESVASDNVKDELDFAIQAKKDIYPVLYKKCKIPLRLRRIQRIDLTGNYNSGLARLTKALTTKQRKPSAKPKTPKSKSAGSKPAAPYKLRKTPKTLSEEEVKTMLADKGFYDKDKNPNGTGVKHQYEAKDINGDKIVIDHATGLTWQQSGSGREGRYEKAQAYIRKLNKEKYAGYSDWRLPTLEEAMSLVERKENADGLYIDPVFDKKQIWIWTSNKYSPSGAWVVDFGRGYCGGTHVDGNHLVRAVC